MNNHTSKLIRGEIRVEPCYTVFFEHCTDCKATRCIMQSDLCSKTVEFKTEYYPGRNGMSIADSLRIDMEQLIPCFDVYMECGRLPQYVDTVISE